VLAATGSAAHLLIGRHIFGDDELALAAREAVDVHDRHASGEASLQGHCTEPSFSNLP